MSEPTIIDAEFEETGVAQVEVVRTNHTIKERVAELESLVLGLIEANKSILEHMREMIIAVTEISEESSEE
jgi:hypothetical protein